MTDATRPLSALQLSMLVGHADTIASQQVAVLIRSHCVLTLAPDGGTWLDTAPMVDEREVSAATADFHRVVLAYAQMRGITFQHPLHAHLVRLLRDE